MGAESENLFHLPPGWRVTIAGRTGSGKSTLAIRYLARSRYSWIIFNPKWTRAYDRLRPETLGKITTAGLDSAVRRHKYVDLHFGEGWGWEEQDMLLSYITSKYENIGVVLDELGKIHNNGRFGPGLDGLLTRGRELRQSYLGLCQRPKFISLYCFSEADAVIEFQLTFLEDRKRIVEATGYRAALERMRGHDFLYLPVASEKPILYRTAA